MEQQYAAQKSEALASALASAASAYYTVDLTLDQVLEIRKSSFPGETEATRFSELCSRWRQYVEDSRKPAYDLIFSREELLNSYARGQSHVSLHYRGVSAAEAMLYEQHVSMYSDGEAGDTFAALYILSRPDTPTGSQVPAQYSQLQFTLSAVDEILKSMDWLEKISSEEALVSVIPELMASLGQFAKADRAYLFDLVPDKPQTLQMTSEWCAPGVRPTFSDMQDLRLSDMPNWTPKLLRGEAILSPNWDLEKQTAPQEYALFDGQNIRCLIIIPLIAGNNLKGFVGFDNPEKRTSALSLRLLKSVSSRIVDLRENLRMMNRLENALTDATFNSEIIDSLSKLYWLIYQMDLTQGTYEEISAGQEMHRLTGKHGKIAEFFQDVRRAIIAPDQQEIMESFLDMDTLVNRLQDTESVAQEYRTANGSWHLARFVVKKRNASGQVTHVLYVVRLIDRQKQLELDFRRQLLESAEEAKRANIAKTNFLRRMSHDIRTPINGIRGMIAIGNYYPDDPEKQKECRDRITQASGFLLELVNGVLDMTKLESGAFDLEETPFNLQSVLKEARNLLEIQVREQAITLEFSPIHVRHLNLIGSPLHLRQALQNITDNAILYNRPGGRIALCCDELPGSKENAVIRITCTDTGRGMSREFLQQAFEPFAQEQQGARTQFAGSGLGLPITKQLIELMEGTIQIQSQPDIGTTVTMTIPFRIDRGSQKLAAPTGKETPIVLAGCHAMIVEDNDLNMDIAKFYLEKSGVIVTAAWNGQEAVNLFRGSKPGYFDFILMDLMMPVMGGLEAAGIIRKTDRPDADIPIIAMTANAFPEDVLQSKQAGMNAHLAKPVQEEDLLRAINRCLRSR